MRVALTTRWRTAALAAGALVAIASATLALALHRIGPPPLAAADALSVTVLDRDDRLLRAYTTSDGRWRLPVGLDDVDPTYVKMLLAFEDRRFFSHLGVDPIGYVRILTEIPRHGRLISGGSTLTMQTARLLDARHDKTATGKARQMLRALQLEAKLSKREILELYLRLAPFGGNIEGVRAATLAYFGKEPRKLSLGEAALLVAIPQSPAARRPDRRSDQARVARNRVLAVAAERGAIPRLEAEAAMREPMPLARATPPQLAPHFADALIADHPTRKIHRTTLDARLQARLETLAREHAQLLGPGLSTALVVVDHTTGQILARVGSAGYLDETRQGAIDMLEATRSPGSTLKPLIYGLGFEQGVIHPETLIEDRPARFGTYVPKNFDHDWQGTVTIREALAKSLNIPAVKILDAIGPAKFTARFATVGVTPELPEHAKPNLALALGGVGLTPIDLAKLYVAIARGGAPIAVTGSRDASVTTAPQTSLLSPLAAWHIRDILKNAPPPTSARAGLVAYKTGTSYGHRDAWSAGFDGRHTIIVWVGRPDGAAVPELSGRRSAAPLLFDAFQRVSETRTPLAGPPAGARRLTTADLAPNLRRFDDPREAVGQGAFKAPPVAIAFPPDKSEIEARPSDGDPVIVRAEGGALPLTWLVDGAPIPSDPALREATLAVSGRGFVKLTVVDAAGRTDRVTVRLK